MKKIPDEKFKAELEGIRHRLPKRYYAIINHLHPGQFSKVNIYNVLHHGVENQAVLEALKEIAISEKENISNGE